MRAFVNLSDEPVVFEKVDFYTIPIKVFIGKFTFQECSYILQHVHYGRQGDVRYINCDKILGPIKSIEIDPHVVANLSTQFLEGLRKNENGVDIICEH